MLFRARFYDPLPTHWCCGEIDELIRQFSSRPMTRQCEKEGGDLGKLKKFPRTGWATENLTSLVLACVAAVGRLARKKPCLGG